MSNTMIGIIGDFDSSKPSQVMLNQSLDWLKESMDFEYEWIDTARVINEGLVLLSKFCGIWSAPGSPFESLDGAIAAIQYARLHNIPHLGTCAGFQHTVIEFARNVLGIEAAQHEEYDRQASVLFINRLACSLSGKTLTLQVQQGTLAYECYQRAETTEDYYCNFGINPAFRDSLIHPGLRISGVDQENEIRILEIPGHDFFMATLFVPQSRMTKARPHPIIQSFVNHCVVSSEWDAQQLV